MGIDRIASVNVFVKDLDAAIEFYDGVLALPFGRRTDNLVSLYTGSSVLNVIRAGRDDLAQVGRATGIGLRMRGLGELGVFARRLEGKGRSITERDIVPWRDGAALEIRDPDGNRLTLYESEQVRDDLTVFEGPSCVVVRVRSVRKALETYLGVFELSMLDQPDPNTVVLLPGGTQLVLTDRGAPSPSAPIDGETGICLEISDAERTLDDLAGRGVRFATPPRLAGTHWVAGVRDLDGNVLTLLGKAS